MPIYNIPNNYDGYNQETYTGSVQEQQMFEENNHYDGYKQETYPGNEQQMFEENNNFDQTYSQQKIDANAVKKIQLNLAHIYWILCLLSLFVGFGLFATSFFLTAMHLMSLVNLCIIAGTFLIILSVILIAIPAMIKLIKES